MGATLLPDVRVRPWRAKFFSHRLRSAMAMLVLALAFAGCGGAPDCDERFVGVWRVRDLTQLALFRLPHLDRGLEGASPELVAEVASTDAVEIVRDWPQLSRDERVARVVSWLRKDEVQYVFRAGGTGTFRARVGGERYEEWPLAWTSAANAVRLTIDQGEGGRHGLTMSIAGNQPKVLLVIEPSELAGLELVQ